MLSGKSMDEIRWLLDDYGIKHGPVVESTRALYEKKLREAMAKQRKKPQSDRTNYREDAEEVTYVHRDRPAQYDLVSNRTLPDHRWGEYTDELPIYRTQEYRNMTQSKNSHYDLVSDRAQPGYRYGGYTDELPIYRSQEYRNMTQSKNSHYDLVSDRAQSGYRYGGYTDEPPIYRSQASYRNLPRSRNLPPESQSKEPPENGSTRLVPVWLQILVFLIVSGLLYLVFINMESADPIERLT